MVVRRDRKSRYYRGSRTHGWGRVAQHRRSGRKGGSGMSGFHKHKWSWVVKYMPDWYGKHGFTRHPSIVPAWRVLNVGRLDEMVDELVKRNLAKKVDGGVLVDITALGFNKLGGAGRVSRPLIVRTVKATENAVEKIVAAGGKVEVVGGGQSGGA